MKLRDATPADLPALVEIYNEVIATTDAIWLDEPVTPQDHRAAYTARTDAGFPTLVAVGEAGEILGYGSFGPFRTKSGYWPTVEHTIHVHHDHRGVGVGQALLDALVEQARRREKHVMVAGIDGGNVGSIRFHERNGFREVGRLPRVGRKGGRPVDLVLLQRDL